MPIGEGQKGMVSKNALVAVNIETKILTMRGQKVMLDADLAELYGVEIRALNQAVKRNVERFPEDFMFQLSTEEYESLRSQFVTLKTGRGQHRKYLPYVFTEHGALMLGNVLKSERAVEISVHIVRAFVHLRELVSGHKELAQKLNQLERKVGAHDRAIAEIINAIRELMTLPDEKKKRPIGFAPWKEK
jgi:phage regulator Rha-like protein